MTWIKFGISNEKKGNYDVMKIYPDMVIVRKGLNMAETDFPQGRRLLGTAQLLADLGWLTGLGTS